MNKEVENLRWDLTSMLDAIKNLYSLLYLHGRYFREEQKRQVGYLALELGDIAWNIDYQIRILLQKESEKATQKTKKDN